MRNWFNYLPDERYPRDLWCPPAAPMASGASASSSGASGSDGPQGPAAARAAARAAAQAATEEAWERPHQEVYEGLEDIPAGADADPCGGDIPAGADVDPLYALEAEALFAHHYARERAILQPRESVPFLLARACQGEGVRVYNYQTVVREHGTPPWDADNIDTDADRPPGGWAPPPSLEDGWEYGTLIGPCGEPLVALPGLVRGEWVWPMWLYEVAGELGHWNDVEGERGIREAWDRAVERERELLIDP